MNILLLEPFFGGSHAQWSLGLKEHSQHEIEILSLPDRHWKWRMHGGAISLAKQFLASSFHPDLILASDMLDLNIFLSLTRSRTNSCKTAIYFHENQLSYPWSPGDEDTKLKRDMHYAFINVSSALAADKLYFNSQYHLNSFVESLPKFLKAFPDHQETWMIRAIEQKSEVLALALDLHQLKALKPENVVKTKRATILWNHRWEYDKNPDEFFKALYTLKERGVDFKLIVLGEEKARAPQIFSEAKIHLAENIIHWGYAANIKEYVSLLWQADILPVCAIQDFFGGSVVEAMACDIFPLLPNRLAYPEHLPPKFQETFLYNNFEDLVNRLQRLIFDVSLLRKQNIHQWVEKYDWLNCIEDYNQRFENLLQNER